MSNRTRGQGAAAREARRRGSLLGGWWSPGRGCRGRGHRRRGPWPRLRGPHRDGSRRGRRRGHGSSGHWPEYPGPKTALVTLEEFGDFQCSHCVDFALGMGRQVKEEFVSTGRIRFVFRHYPFIGEESFRAAEGTECAADQGKFWEYHDIVFENWKGVNEGHFSDDKLKGFARTLGLDSALLRRVSRRRQVPGQGRSRRGGWGATRRERHPGSILERAQGAT